MGEIQTIFSKNLRFYREMRGFTQMELATRADLSLNFVSMIELGRKFPSPESLEALATALAVQVFQLFLSEDPINDIEAAGLEPIHAKRYLSSLSTELVEFNRKYFDNLLGSPPKPGSET